MGATILVVDKDVLVRALIADILRECGFICIEAGRVNEALDVLHISPSQIDLVISSLQLQGDSNEGAFVRLARVEFPFIKILVVSGVAPDPSCSAAIDGYLRKPFLPSQLIQKVETLLPKRKQVSP